MIPEKQILSDLSFILRRSKFTYFVMLILYVENYFQVLLFKVACSSSFLYAFVYFTLFSTYVVVFIKKNFMAVFYPRKQFLSRYSSF